MEDGFQVRESRYTFMMDETGMQTHMDTGNVSFPEHGSQNVTGLLVIVRESVVLAPNWLT